jgi:frizzled protein 3
MLMAPAVVVEAIPMESAAGSHSMFTCEPITLRMCQGLPYNSTFMPNLLNHYDQQTAALAMEVNTDPLFFMTCSLSLALSLSLISRLYHIRP